MSIKRLHYFDRQFLVEADFTDEQQYHLDMRRRLNRLPADFLVMVDGSDSSIASQALAAANGVTLSRSIAELLVRGGRLA